MSEFGWTRLAYLSVTLIILALLVKLGTFGAASFSENFPDSSLTFAHNNGPVFEEHLDWESQAADFPNAAPSGDEHSDEPHSDEHSDESHSDESHSDESHSDESHSDESHSGEHGHSHEPVESIYENVNFAEGAPVFYRPVPRVGGASRSPSSSGAADESCQTLGDAPPGSEILFPMTRDHFDSYEDTWGAARPQGGHEGTDLMAPNGTPLLAMTDGRIVPVSGADANGWNTLGGYTVMLEAAYSVGPVKKGDLFYYAHLDRQSDLRVGDTVEAGDAIGFVGDTGEGPEGTRGNFPPHLHLGWYDTSGGRTQLASGAMNPFPLLEWVKANGGSIAGGSDIPYCEAPQPAAPTPSGGGYWQFPSDPGTRPDMATGTGTAAPSPIVEQNESSEFSPDITREPVRPTPNPANPNPANPNPANPNPANPNPANPNPAPPEGGGTESPTPPSPPTGGTSPSVPQPPIPNLPIPNIPNPLPGIGAGIGDIIGGILNPSPPKPPDNETTPPSPSPPPAEESAAPEKTTGPDAPPGSPEEADEEEGTAPEDTDSDGKPVDEADEDECEPRDRGGGEEEEESGEPGEKDEEPRGGGDCSEEMDAEDEDSPSEEEATGPDTSEAVGDQYGEPSNPEDGNTEDGNSAPETDSPETDSPETDSPETDSPETDSPETDSPETDSGS